MRYMVSVVRSLCSIGRGGVNDLATGQAGEQPKFKIQLI